ncbi:hypothetical protein [Streptomyces sp. NPDC053367]
MDVVRAVDLDLKPGVRADMGDGDDCRTSTRHPPAGPSPPCGTMIT